MKIIITGSTGMVGSEVIRQALLDDGITEVTAIARKPLNIKHTKLRTIIHNDFLNYSSLADVFKKNDACLWCLGISQNVVNKEEYIKITYDYTIAAAKAMLEANPGIHFLFLSGEGADTKEKSRMLFGRIKGKTENALLKLPFEKLHIARPAGILPIHKNSNMPFILKLQYGLVRVLRPLFPSQVITSDDLAKALLHIVKSGASHPIIMQKELKQLGKAQSENVIPN